MSKHPEWNPPTFEEGTPDLEVLQGLSEYEADWLESLPTPSAGAFAEVWSLVDELGFSAAKVGMDKHAEVGAKLAVLFDKGQIAVLRNVAEWEPPPIEFDSCPHCNHKFDPPKTEGPCPHCGHNINGYS